MLARFRRHLRALALASLVVVVAAGCQVELATTIEVRGNGSGTITQAAGFDAAALARVGDLDRQLQVEDLRQAGWTVDAPVEEDGTTWVRAHHDFDDPAEANALLAQLSGPDGPYRDLTVTRDAGLLSTTTKVTGTLDASGGAAIFGDPDLTATLGGDPSGGLVGRIEAEEGKPVGEMVDLSVTIDLPGADETVSGPLGGSAQPIDVSSSEGHLLTRLGQVVLIGLVLLTAAVVALRFRVRYLRRKRMMRSNLPRR